MATTGIPRSACSPLPRAGLTRFGTASPEGSGMSLSSRNLALLTSEHSRPMCGLPQEKEPRQAQLDLVDRRLATFDGVFASTQNQGARHRLARHPVGQRRPRRSGQVRAAGAAARLPTGVVKATRAQIELRSPPNPPIACLAKPPAGRQGRVPVCTTNAAPPMPLPPPSRIAPMSRLPPMPLIAIRLRQASDLWRFAHTPTYLGCLSQKPLPHPKADASTLA